MTGTDVLYDNPTHFRIIVGDLQYLVVSRSDSQYVVNLIAQTMYKPRKQDFHALKHILRYIQGTIT